MLNTGVSLQRLATKAGVGFTPKKLFSNGEAGVWYDPSDVEASLTWRRNLLEYTESLDNSYWGKGPNTVVTPNHGVAPNGTQTADRVEFAATSGTYFAVSKNLESGKTYTFSVYAKATSSTSNFDLYYNDGSGTNQQVGQQTATSEWQRFEYTITTVGVSTQFGVNNAGDTYASDILFWGAQLEEGSTATEYQPIRSTFYNAFLQAFPKHTLMQSHQGRTPVTALGQPVGLMLDKSQGVAFGSQLVTTPNFDSATGWSTGIGHSIIGGQLVYDGTGAQYQKTRTNVSVTNGKLYKIVVDIASLSGSNINVGLADGAIAFTNPQNTLSTIGIHTIYQYADAASAKVAIQNNSATQTWAVNSITVEEVSGSHATQSDSTKRPVFARHPERGRVNLFKHTEEFDNGYWSKSFVTVNSNFATAPNGSQTAVKVTETTDYGQHLVYRTGVTQTGSKVFSVYVKQGSGSRLLRMIDYNATNGGQGETYFNITNGTVAQGSGIIENAGNGWYRCSITSTTTVASQYYISMGKEVSAGNYAYNYTGDGSSNFYIWGAQLEKANEATGYQKVVDDYDITESGYKSVYYLQFDGINDTMAVQPVTGTNAPISVFMGHDTEGNASTAGYFLDIQDGRFLLAGAGYYTTASNWQNGTNIDATAKGVSTVVSDGTNADYRRDGIVERTGALANVSIQGDIAIFSRYDYTTNIVNGNMYQLVIRGATSTDKEIDQAEEFVAIKTGLKSEVVGLATLDLNFGANTYTARNSNGSVL